MRRACGARHSGEQFNNAMHICLRFPDCTSRELDMRLMERLLFGNYCLVYIREFFFPVSLLVVSSLPGVLPEPRTKFALQMF
ncbi:unnamed protein product [Sphagnum balticum]